jgi:hypothetical protein
MYPWDHYEFQWDNKPTFDIKDTFVFQNWSWGPYKGNGFSWELSKPGVFKLFLKDIDPNYIEWPTIFLHERTIDSHILSNFGWSPYVQSS